MLRKTRRRNQIKRFSSITFAAPGRARITDHQTNCLVLYRIVTTAAKSEVYASLHTYVNMDCMFYGYMTLKGSSQCWYSSVKLYFSGSRDGVRI